MLYYPSKECLPHTWNVYAFCLPVWPENMKWLCFGCFPSLLEPELKERLPICDLDKNLCGYQNSFSARIFDSERAFDWSNLLGCSEVAFSWFILKENVHVRLLLGCFIHFPSSAPWTFSHLWQYCALTYMYVGDIQHLWGLFFILL